MTRILILLFIITFEGMGQDAGTLKLETTYNGDFWARADSNVHFGFIEPSHSIVIKSPSGKTFNIDFAHDTLTTSGNMELDSAAHYFVKYLIEAYDKRIKDLVRESEDYTARTHRLQKVIHEMKKAKP